MASLHILAKGLPTVEASRRRSARSLLKLDQIVCQVRSKIPRERKDLQSAQVLKWDQERRRYQNERLSQGDDFRVVLHQCLPTLTGAFTAITSSEAANVNAVKWGRVSKPCPSLDKH